MALAKDRYGGGEERVRQKNGQRGSWKVRLASECASLTVVWSVSCWFYLRNIYRILPFLAISMATTLARASIISHVIHSNVVLTDLCF